VQQRLHFIFDDSRVPTEDDAEQPNGGGASPEESEARNYLNYILSMRGEVQKCGPRENL
jgi:hypothetical protein